MKRHNTQLYLTISYGIILLIWLSTNFFGSDRVYAETSAEIQTETAPPPEVRPTAEAAPQADADPVISVSDKTLPEFLEKYVIGVVAAEMPVYFPEEALKAQAVAARTYAYREYTQNSGVHLPDIGQAYLSDEQLRAQWKDDFEENYTKVKTAVSDTSGEIIMYEDAPILAVFCSASGGITEQSENVWGTALPYLRSVPSEYDKKAPVYTQQLSLGTDRLAALLGIADASDITITNRSTAGYVISASAGGYNFSGDVIRRALGLRSNDFYISIEGDTADITAYGFGHGVGMSQYGARYMAEEGADYTDILMHYYTDVYIEKLEIR